MNVKDYIIRVLLGIFYVIVAIFLFHSFGRPIFNGNDMDLLLFSAFVTLIINVFFTGFFETPKDVIASSINVLILLAPFLYSGNTMNVAIKWMFFYAFICLACASLSVILYDPSGTTKKSFVSNWFKKVATQLGNSRLLFGLLIGCAILSVCKSDVSSSAVSFYFILLVFFLVVSSEKLQSLLEFIFTTLFSFFLNKIYEMPEPIGKMVAVQSKDTFIIDLVDSTKRKTNLRLFDFVEFRYGANDNMFVRGFVIDRYSLDSKQKVKVLGITTRHDDKNHGFENNIVYKISDNNVAEHEKEILNSFVGTVVEQSDISKIKFEYSPNKLLTSGDLLHVDVKMINEESKAEESTKVLYQITQAITDVQKLDNHNEAGLIVAQAVQLGVWRPSIRSFENYGWVPAINTKVMLAKDIRGPEPKEGELELGKIENTEFKVVVNIDELVTHHTAILGTTGTGKSVFARNIINGLANNGTKVFCIDFTGEMREKIQCEDLQLNTDFIANHIIVNQYNKVSGVSPKKASLIEHIEHYSLNKNVNLISAEKDHVSELMQKIIDHIKIKLRNFIKDDRSQICLFELQEISNTDVSLEYTKFLFMALFDLAKKESMFSSNKKGCIVIEEAHTVIPEWNMTGGTDKISSKLTNTISQIALQGRKYNVGLMVIAQRTANVSKTILTQCNTVISFKQLDNTSRDYLINHFGEEFVKVLPNLKFRQAIIAGKALVSDMPIMFKVPELPNEDIQKVESPQDPYFADGAFVEDQAMVQHIRKVDFDI